MNFILDTQAFLWLTDGNKNLSPKSKRYYLDSDNEIYLSDVSIWEMAIKINLKKLNINMPLESFIEDHAIGNDIKILEIKSSHLYKLESLPLHHRDPFDRAIIAQCMSEGFKILGNDKIFDSYPVDRIW